MSRIPRPEREWIIVIGANALKGCTDVTEVVIPAVVPWIGASAFKGLSVS